MEEEIISIRIGGLEYKLQCPVEEQPHLLEAAEKLDKKIKSTKRKLKTLPMERISVLAAFVTTNPKPTKVETCWSSYSLLK